MKAWIGAAIVTAALAAGGAVATGSAVAASAKARVDIAASPTAEVQSATEFSARRRAQRRHHRHGFRPNDKLSYRPCYCARPYYYRPYPYYAPAPFPFGFGFGPSW